MSFPGITAGTAGTNFILPTVTAIAGPSAAGTSHVFSNLAFGPDTANRLICVMVYAQTKPSGSSGFTNINYTNSRLGGVAMYGGDPGTTWNFEYYAAAAGNTSFIGILDAVYQPVGSSGSLVFNTQITTQCSVALISTTTIVNANASLANSFNANYNGSGTSVTAKVDTQSLSTLFAGGITNDSGITTSFDNVTKLAEFEHVAGYHCAVGASYPLAAQSARTTTFSKTGSAHPMATQLDLWQ